MAAPDFNVLAKFAKSRGRAPQGNTAPPVQPALWLNLKEAAGYLTAAAAAIQKVLAAIDVGIAPDVSPPSTAPASATTAAPKRKPIQQETQVRTPLLSGNILPPPPVQIELPLTIEKPAEVATLRVSSMSELDMARRELRKGLVSQNSVLGYGFDWRMFCGWAKSRGLDSLPATAETVVLYLTDLLTQGKKITTARRRKCAIFYEHVSRGVPVPASAEIRELLRGAQRIRGEKPRQMRPVSVQELRRMSAKLASIGTPRALRDRALLVVGFASALRRSNLGALKLADIEFVPEGVILNIEREKGDQEGRGRFIGIARGRHADTCPVRVLRAWLRVRGDKPGPLFPSLDRRHPGTTLAGDSICRLVRRALTLIGIDPTEYGAHSLRAGFVTAAGEANVGELVIASQTGHRSTQMVRRYFRRSDLWRSNASSSLGL